MATQCFLLDTVADTHLGTDNANLIGSFVGWTSRALGLARGSGVVASDATATVAGTTLGVEVAKTAKLEWISPPLAADVTIAGTITANIWGREAAAAANVAINVVVEVIRANATATRDSNTLVQIVKSARTTEMAISATTNSVANFTMAPTSTAVNRGDRLRVRVFGDDAGTMGASQTFQIGYSGTTAAANGDTYVTFTENFSFEGAPAGSQLFLTDAHPGLSGVPALLSSFTGADENPLSEGGNWAQLNLSTTAMQRVSGMAGATTTSSHSYWTPANLGPDMEGYLTVPAWAGTSQGGILARIQGEGGAATHDGYMVRALSASFVQIVRVLNGTGTAIVNASMALASGDKLGIRCKGSVIEAWWQQAGGWKLLASIVDTSYPGAGKVALFSLNTADRLDDFYAATGSSLFTQEAWTSRGGGVRAVVAPSQLGAPFIAPGQIAEWYTRRLAAFTLSGMAVANLRALESNVAANASLRCEIARVDSDGTNATVWSSWCIAPTGTDNGELTASEVARTANVSGDDLAISAGQRLRIRVYVEDLSSAAVVSGHTVTVFHAGTSAAASGDSYITLPQTVTEYSAATGGPATLLSTRRLAANRYLTSR